MHTRSAISKSNAARQIRNYRRHRYTIVPRTAALRPLQADRTDRILRWWNKPLAASVGVASVPQV